MKEITEAHSNGAFAQEVVFEKMMAGVVDWYRESPDSIRRLMASIYGVKLKGTETETGSMDPSLLISMWERGSRRPRR